MMDYVVGIFLTIQLVLRCYRQDLYGHLFIEMWCFGAKHVMHVKEGPKNLTYGPQQLIMSYGPFEKWGIDAIGPLPRTARGKEYIIMGVDYMTRWVEAAPITRITAQDVGKFIFDNICCRFGTPLEIISDRGPGFRGELVGELMKRLKIKQ